MEYNAEIMANKLTVLLFSGYCLDDIAEMAHVSQQAVEMVLNQQKPYSDRGQRHLIPAIERLYQALPQPNYAKK